MCEQIIAVGVDTQYYSQYIYSFNSPVLLSVRFTCWHFYNFLLMIKLVIRGKTFPKKDLSYYFYL